MATWVKSQTVNDNGVWMVRAKIKESRAPHFLHLMLKTKPENSLSNQILMTIDEQTENKQRVLTINI